MHAGGEKLKLNAEKRIAVVGMGLLFSWAVVYMMIQSLYQGLQRTIISSVQGGTYPLLILQSEEFVIWVVLVSASCILLAIGLMAEKEETSTST